jgi:hypothetical protein
LQKMTAWVIVRVSYRSHSVSNFHSSFSTATKNCLMPCWRATANGHGSQRYWELLAVWGRQFVCRECMASVTASCGRPC